MTDELSIQAGAPQVKQTSSTPYVLGGAVLGAGAGYGAARIATKPKYESLDDIVKEAQDKFESSVKEVSDDKSIQDKAIAARKKLADADTEYEKMWNDYKAENAGGDIIKDDNYKNLEKELSDKKAAVDTKRAELEKVEAAKIKASAKGSKQVAPKQLYNELADLIYKADGDVNALSKADKTINAALDNVVSGLQYTGTKEEIEAAKAATKKEIYGYIQELAGKNIVRGKASKTPKLVSKQKGLVESKASYQDAIKKETENAYNALNKALGGDFKALYERDANIAERKLNNYTKIQEKKIAKLTEFKKAYGEILKKQGAVNVNVLDVLAGLFSKSGIKVVNEASKETLLERFTAGLSDADKRAFKKLLGNDISVEKLDEAIKDAEGKKNVATEAYNTIANPEKNKNIKAANAKIKKINNELKGVQKELRKEYGKGAEIKNGVIYDKKGNKVKIQKPALEMPKLELPKGVTIPNDYKVASLGEALTEEQIAQKARESVTDNMLKAELDAQSTAQKALDDAKAKLPKAEGKSEADLKKAFEELKGTKEKYMAEVKASAKEDLKALLERKIPGGKLATYIAGGAAALALIGYAMAPKSKEV